MANSTSSLSAGPVHGAKTSFIVLFIVYCVSSGGGGDDVPGGLCVGPGAGSGSASVDAGTGVDCDGNAAGFIGAGVDSDGSATTSLFNAIRHAICVVQTNPNAGVLRADPVPWFGESPHPVKNRCWCSRLSSLRVPMRYDPSSSACCESAGESAGEELMFPVPGDNAAADGGGRRTPPLSIDSRRSET